MSKINCKFILFNGPAKAGKDEAVKYLINSGINLVQKECKDHLHKLVQTFFNVPEERYLEIYNDRNLKEKPLPEFHVDLTIEDFDQLFDLLYPKLDENFDPSSPTFRNNKFSTVNERNLSIREAMIYISEVIYKPRFGMDYFGKVRCSSLQDKTIYYDASCGFQEELPPLFEKVNQNNILLFRVTRDGCVFDGDSRRYIKDGVVKNTIDVYNNSDINSYLKFVQIAVQEFLDSRERGNYTKNPASYERLVQ